ncbi:MAG: hypothetical protein ACRDD1_07140, partial [Planctomycetia bacterium]
PWSADALHFDAWSRAARSDLRGAWVRHFLAGLIGEAAKETTVLSNDFLTALADRPSSTLPPELVSFIEAYAKSDNPERIDDVARLLATIMPTDEAERAVVGYLTAMHYETKGNHTAAVAEWRRTVADHPWHLPALCRLGEALEVDPATAAEADRLFEAARRLAPENPRVSRLYRLGGSFRSTKDGVRLERVEPNSILYDWGLRTGDEIIGLDGRRLDELDPAERLLTARLFQGGRVVYRIDGKEETAVDCKLVLFRFQ